MFTSCCSAAPADPRLRRQVVVRELYESHPAAPAWATAPEQPHEVPEGNPGTREWDPQSSALGYVFATKK